MTDLFLICDTCLGEDEYIQMIKEENGEECKLCTRPFTVFRWRPTRSSKKHTIICHSCAKSANCCQCCMLDLTYGIPVAMREAALKMAGEKPLIEALPDDKIARRYLALKNEEEGDKQQLALTAGLSDASTVGMSAQELLTAIAEARGKAPAEAPPKPGALAGKAGKAVKPKFAGTESVVPPQDKSIASLFVSGVEDDLAEYQIREHFAKFGELKSVVCLHKARSAFVNFKSRASAEAAVKATKKGKLVLHGSRLSVSWSKTKG